MEFDLSCRYDARQSFYGKARVKEERKKDYCKLSLISYSTTVATIEYFYKDLYVEKAIYQYFGKYSQTTTRHQKEFFKQNNLSDKEIKQLFKDGSLTITYIV